MLLLGSEVQRGETVLVCEVHLVAVFVQESGHVSGPALHGCIVQRPASGPINVGSHVSSMSQVTARVLVALVLVVFWCWRDRALCGWGFILSPSATLRVAGQSPGSRWSALLDERPWPGGFGLLGLSWLMASGWTSTTSTKLLPWCLLCPVHP